MDEGRKYRGSKIVPVRIDDVTLSQIETIVARSVTHAKEEPYTVSSWIKKCIQEKLDHLERARKPRRLRREIKQFFEHKDE